MVKSKKDSIKLELKTLCELNLTNSEISDKIKILSKVADKELFDSIDKLNQNELKNLKINIEAFKNYENKVQKYADPIIEISFAILLAAVCWVIYILNKQTIDLISLNNNILYSLPVAILLIKGLISLIKNLYLGLNAENNFNAEKLVAYVLNSKY